MEKGLCYLEIGSFLVVDDNEFPPILTDMYENAKIFGEDKREDLESFYGGNYVPVDEHKNRSLQLIGMIKRTESHLIQLKNARTIHEMGNK